MKRLQRLALIGNHLPRRCGIATFTHDLHAAIATPRPALETCIVAMSDAGLTYDYPERVRFKVRDDQIEDYVRAADFLKEGRFEAVSLQHEYGIFGGEAGANIIALLSRLDVPVITTLHTVLPYPSAPQERVMRQILDMSERVVVMSAKGQELLSAVHGVPGSKIEIIPHGIPDLPFAETLPAKAKCGFAGKTVILTFGLLSPSKGIETMIDAMPDIIASCPNVIYVVLGATHPNLVREQGEAYRECLTTRVRELGIEGHVVFVNQFVDQATLLDFISMCDVYVTPYLNEAQMTSGTLAYSFGLGKAVVSTPYWHAKELLADSRGVLVPFGNPTVMGVEIAALLTNDVRRHAMRKRAYATSRSMTWAQTADRYLAAFDTARRSHSLHRLRPTHRLEVPGVPDMRIGYLLSMCDSTGLMQHAVHGIPDRAHGYCVDDNARALLLASTLGGPGEPRLPETLTTRFAGFIQHAWNPDTGRFRNFMSYDRRWLEDQGSEDSHGRTLWSLGVCARRDTDAARRAWALNLFKTALPASEQFSSPRAWAFSLLGLNACGAMFGDDSAVNRLQRLLADRLMSSLAFEKPDGWFWFEDVLAYDNARLPQALIEFGVILGTPAYLDAGLRSLRWLMSHQTAPSGCFRPVGSHSFGKRHASPEHFDQQPLEAAATISACLAASRVDGSHDWSADAMQAFNWFLGCNDLQIALADRDTGSCLDGLHADRANANKGAESVLSYLLGLAEIRRSLREDVTPDTFKHSAVLALSA